MRIVVEEEIKLEDVSEEDLSFLKKCSVLIRFNTEKYSTLTIVPQKIDLFESDMEIILDIIYFKLDDDNYKRVVLERYETGRYKLKLV